MSAGRLRFFPLTSGKKERDDELALFLELFKRLREKNTSLLDVVSTELEPIDESVNKDEATLVVARKGKEVIFQPATKFLPMINKVHKILLEKTKFTPRAKVVKNKFCVLVHFRCVNEKRWSALADQVKYVLKQYPKLRLTPGRKALKIRPTIKWDKGKAMEFMLESLDFANCKDVFPIYIGDDRTDEDSFKGNPKLGAVVNALGHRVKPYLPPIRGTIKWRRLDNKSAKVIKAAQQPISSYHELLCHETIMKSC